MSARRTPRTEALAGVLLATALGVIFAAALVHWIDLEGITTHPAPSEAGTTAKAAGLSLLAMPGYALRRVWAWIALSWQIRSNRRKLQWTEEDILHKQEDLAWLPTQIRMYEREAERLRAAIALAERQLESGELPVHSRTLERL